MTQHTWLPKLQDSHTMRIWDFSKSEAKTWPRAFLTTTPIPVSLESTKNARLKFVLLKLLFDGFHFTILRGFTFTSMALYFLNSERYQHASPKTSANSGTTCFSWVSFRLVQIIHAMMENSLSFWGSMQTMFHKSAKLPRLAFLLSIQSKSRLQIDLLASQFHKTCKTVLGWKWQNSQTSLEIILYFHILCLVGRRF